MTWYLRYSPQGVEYGPFSDGDREYIEATSWRRTLFWRHENEGVQLSLFQEAS